MRPFGLTGNSRQLFRFWGVVIPGWKKWPDRRHRDGNPRREDTEFHACTIPNSQGQGYTVNLCRMCESGMRETGCLNVGPS